MTVRWCIMNGGNKEFKLAYFKTDFYGLWVDPD